MKREMLSIIAGAVVLGATAIAAGVPGQAATSLAGDQRVMVVRTVEDPGVSSLPPGCPFENPNVLLGATVWSLQTQAGTGEMVNDSSRQIGTASACGKITTALVPGAQAPFYIEFDTTAGTFVAQGTCTVTSNNIPVPGLILAGCALRADAAPGILGGSVTSNSVFNPQHLPGFDTGSIWTLRLYPD